MSYLKDSIIYGGSTIASQIVALFRGIFIRIILIPEILGLYNLIQVILASVSVLNLGANAAAGRDLPIYSGKKDIKKISIIRSTVLWFTIGQSLLVAICTTLYPIIFISEYTYIDLMTYGIASLLLICASIFSSYDVFFSSSQKYSTLSLVIFIVGIFEAITYVGGAYFMGINGLLIGVVLSALLKVFISVFFALRSEINVKLNFSFMTIKKLLNYGFPLKLVDYPMGYMGIIDLIWVAKFMDISSLAVYTTANLFYKQTNQVGISFGKVFETRIIEYFGKLRSWKKNAVIIRKYIYFQLLVVVPITISISAILVPFILRHFIPKYIGASDAVVYLLLANFFVVLNSGLTIPWFVKKKLVHRGISNLVGFVFVILSITYFWFILNMQEISHIAISVAIGYLFYFIFMIIAVGKELWTTNQIIKMLAIIIFGSFWTSFVIVYGYSFTIESLTIIDDLIRSSIIGFITLILISPIIFLGLKLSEFLRFTKLLD